MDTEDQGSELDAGKQRVNMRNAFECTWISDAMN